jgi:ribosomal-protein-serine acetyltransferase
MFYMTVDDEIKLKLLEKRDADDVYSVLDKNRVYLREWLPWVDGMKCKEDYYPIIEMWLKQFAANDGFQVGIYYNGKFVGLIGLHEINWGHKQTSIGYWLDDSSQGKGIMTRCVNALLKYAFEELKLNRVEIRCGEKNYKSRAIPERLEMKHEGTIRDGEFLYDHFIDSYVYSMLAKEWFEKSTKR